MVENNDGIAGMHRGSEAEDRVARSMLQPRCSRSPGQQLLHIEHFGTRVFSVVSVLFPKVGLQLRPAHAAVSAFAADVILDLEVLLLDMPSEKGLVGRAVRAHVALVRLSLRVLHVHVSLKH